MRDQKRQKKKRPAKLYSFLLALCLMAGMGAYFAYAAGTGADNQKLHNGSFEEGQTWIGNYQQRYEIFDKALELFKGKIACFHVKDFIVDGDSLKEVAIGTGIMGWDKLLPQIVKNVPDPILVFEGVPAKEKSLAYFKGLLKK